MDNLNKVRLLMGVEPESPSIRRLAQLNGIEPRTRRRGGHIKVLDDYL